MLAVEVDDLRHRPANGESAADNRACTGSRDEVEAEPEIKRRFATNPTKLISQSGKKGPRIDAAHATAIETQHAVRPYNLLIILGISHSVTSPEP